ncbi:ig family protein [Stylonychia lemnae]|uniref:Ig family protein n=1 Tax=Stylonychia lemnae TaxID=5949 RepID=A0A078AVY6_STYLE|nr:ig family protein [Stylonychia lemnae]|eukprot:CDW84938.1 ig family protein [Stylonychia lemnae]
MVGYSDNSAISCCSNGDGFIGKLGIQTGSISWFKSIGTANIDTLNGIDVSPDGTQIYGVGQSNDDSLIVAIKSDSTVIWTKTIGCPTYQDYLSDVLIEITNNFAYFMGSSSCRSPNTFQDVSLFKMKLNTQVITYQNLYGSNYNDIGINFAYLNKDESLFLVGKTLDTGTFFGGLLIKIDSSGSMSYGFRFAGTTSNNDFCRGVDGSQDGQSVYVTCYTESTGNLGATYLFKIKSIDGSIIKQVKFDSDSKDQQMAVKVDKFGQVITLLNTKSSPYTLSSKLSSTIIRSTPSLVDWNGYQVSSISFTSLINFLQFSGNHNTLTALTVTVTSFPTAFNLATSFLSFTQGSAANTNLIAPQISNYTFPQGTSISITIPQFCQGTTLKSATQVGLDHDMTSLPTGVTYTILTRTLAGTPTIVGVYTIRAIYTNLFGLESSTTFLINVTSVPQIVAPFTLIPNIATLDTLYLYQFTISSFATDNPLYFPLQVSVVLKDGNSIPSWLTFDQSSSTLRGTPRKRDYPDTKFDIQISLKLKVKNNIGNEIITNTANLIIKGGESQSLVNKGPPFFASPLENQLVYTDQVKYYVLPKFYDYDDSAVSIKVEIGKANSFTKFYPNYFKFSPFESDSMMYNGEYEIKIRLRDTNLKYQETNYRFKIKIQVPPLGDDYEKVIKNYFNFISLCHFPMLQI